MDVGYATRAQNPVDAVDKPTGRVADLKIREGGGAGRAVQNKVGLLAGFGFL